MYMGIENTEAPERKIFKKNRNKRKGKLKNLLKLHGR